MSIPTFTRRFRRRSVHPGEVLREESLPEYDLTAARLAAALGVSRQSVCELLRERRALSPEMALRLAQSFGNSAAFWLNLQRAVVPVAVLLPTLEVLCDVTDRPSCGAGLPSRATHLLPEEPPAA